jgi:hypothetical protein
LYENSNQNSSIKYVNEIDSYWSNQDFIELLKMFDFADVEQVSPNDLREMLFIAISDFEPEDAAQILLNYKLGNALTEGQIQSLSHEMQAVLVAEEYPEPELHFDLFNSKQLLFKAYKGAFPNTEASIIEIELPNEAASHIVMSEEIMTKLLSHGLTEKSILRRLYADQIEGKVPFKDAAKFIWRQSKATENSYELISSRYWVEKEDITQTEYESNIIFFKGSL